MAHPDLVAAMKAKYPTLAELDAAGSTGRVAMFCNVEHSDVWLWRQELKEAEKLAHTKQSKERTAKMREEVGSTIEFDTIGDYNAVSKKYGVGVATAHGWRKKLAEMEKGKAGGAQDLPPEEITPTAKQTPEQLPKELTEATTESVTLQQPTQAEREEFFAEPEPDLTNIAKPKALDLAMQLVAQVTEEVTMQLKESQQDGLDKVRQYFTRAIILAEQKARDTNEPAVRLAEQLRLELLRQIECDVITAMNGK